MKKVVILGGGLVGTPMALDLHKNPGIKVVLADRSENQLNRAKQAGIECVAADLMKEGVIESLLTDADFVINALPGSIGFRSLKRAIECGKNGVDIAFYAEDYAELNEIALEKGVCWVVDMGVAPGMSHLLSAFGTTFLDSTHDIKIYVGGLPKDRNDFWQYKAPFSPSDVLEEYTRPARIVRGGKQIILPALSETEILEFPVVGALEAFNSDGLRSLVKSLNVPDMVEKTLRYPGYIDKVNVLKESGLFSTDEINVNGQNIKPFDLTSQLLFNQWKLQEEEVEFTVMQIRVSGVIDDAKRTVVYDLYDEYCPETRIHSMARTTGYAATSVLESMIDGFFHFPGVHPPEILAFNSDLVMNILARLESKGVKYTQTIV
jgi:saccharopine dehydrogenase-like NADP-dependent oxidoreductase